jgi:hypothetical protein
VKKIHQKPSSRPRKRKKQKEQKSGDTGVRVAVLRRWQRLLQDNRFDDRVTALCQQYDLNDYLPIGKSAQGVFTGTLPIWAQRFQQEVIAAGEGIHEGDRPTGADFSARLSKVVETLKREFALGAEFDGPLRRHILWNDTLQLLTTDRLIISGPIVWRTTDRSGIPHVQIEVTPLTSIKDVERLWPIVQKQLREAFPHQNKRPRSTLDEDRLQFILEKRKQEKWTFPQIAQAWQEYSGQPTTHEAVRKAYERARSKSGR